MTTAKQTLDTVALNDETNILEIPFVFVTPSVGDYTLTNLKLNFTILGIDVKTATGTLDLTVEINTTAVVFTTDGTNPLQITTTPQEDTAASANLFTSGDNLVFAVANLGSSPTKLEGTLHCRRT